MLQLSPGVIVAGNYRLDSVVGSGATGIVWKATDLALGRTVALKILHADLNKDPDLQERFKREARLLASLEHPAVVPIYTWLPIEDEKGKLSPCIVMPFLQGRLLSEMLKERAMSIHEAVNVARSLLDGLSAAHAAGIVHRDLKPQNVMLEQRGARLHARILDFGIARSASSPVTALSIVAVTAGRWLGTPEYMSPEQMADPTNIDARADLWAVAVLLYEMLTGQLPFQGRSRVEVVSKILSFAAVPLSAHNKPFPPSLETFFTRCFSKDISQRPSSCEEMLSWLEAAAGVVATPSGSYPAADPRITGSFPAVNTPAKPIPSVLTPVSTLAAQANAPSDPDPRSEPTLVGAPPIPVSTSAPVQTATPAVSPPHHSVAPPVANPTPLPPPPKAVPVASNSKTLLQFSNPPPAPSPTQNAPIASTPEIGRVPAAAPVVFSAPPSEGVSIRKFLVGALLVALLAVFAFFYRWFNG